MAQCVQSVQEFVQDSFVPMVAVLCSEEAERVTRKNNLNFAELLRPFCRLTSEGKRHCSKHDVGLRSCHERGGMFGIAKCVRCEWLTAVSSCALASA